jgi:TRAP-type C4-dicarboxylate transport system permease small subunit
MAMLLGIIGPLAKVNEILLTLGRWLGATALGLMVIIVLAQVWFRYVIGNALAWPDEASRFFMLWLASLMAPTAFRSGGFVAIEMFAMLLPKKTQAVLQLFLLAVTMFVLILAFRIGWAEVTGIGGKFALSSIKVPTSLDFSTWMKVPRAWMMMSFHVCVTLLMMVNIELVLRSLATLLGADDRLPPIKDTEFKGAE